MKECAVGGEYLGSAVVDLVLGGLVPDLGKVVEALEGLVVGEPHPSSQPLIRRALRVRFSAQVVRDSRQLNACACAAVCAVVRVRTQS